MLYSYHFLLNAIIGNSFEHHKGLLRTVFSLFRSENNKEIGKAKASRSRKNPSLSVPGYVCVSAAGGGGV